MLEEATDDRDDADVLGNPWHARAQAADTAHVEVDPHARPRGLIQRLDAAGIDQGVHLQRDPCLLAGAVRRNRRLDLLDDAVAHGRRRDQHLAVLGWPAVASEEVEHLGDVSADLRIGGEEAEVGIEAGGGRVVVAGADVDVLAYPVALAAGDQNRLDMRLQAGDAVDDVHAGLLQRLGPVDVRLLVEASFELDHADRLLAAFGGADQRRHQRRVVAGSVHRLLDRQHVGIGDCLDDEALHRTGEGVVGVVDEDVALADRGKHVDRLVVLPLQAWLGDRGPGLVAQLGVPAGSVDDVAEVGEVDQPVDVVDLAVFEPQRIDQLTAQLLVHSGGDLEPHDLAEAAAAELVLDRLQQVVGLIAHREVGVAGDAEVTVVDDLGAREERVEVGRDRLLERHEYLVVLANPQEAAEQLLRHLDPGDDLGAAVGVAQQHAEAEREVGDIGEGAAEPDDERGQCRKDLLMEAGVDFAPLLLAGRLQRDDADPVLLQRRPQYPGEAAVQAGVELQHPRLDRVDLLPGCKSIGTAGVDSRVELVEQPCHSDHEELVQVGGIDRAEPDPLQQWHLRILRQFENALIEVEPGKLAVEIEGRIVDRAIVLPHPRLPPR